ncbi:MAG: hypothetical protein L3J66_13360 [Bacteroidales bacterium]|nr:hypothetical protein [Bacteroidales bacterium]
MEDQNIEIQKEQPKNSNLWLYIVLIVLALGLIGLSIYMLSMKKNLNELVKEKDRQRVELAEELQVLLVSHDSIKMAYGELSDSLYVKDSVIQANAKEIKQLLNFKWDYYKIKKKLTRLQTVAQTYVLQMDSLYTVNHQLTEENLQMKEEIKIEKRRNRELEGIKNELTEKVDVASVVGAYGVTASPVRVKGSGKESETDKIRRTDRIRVCFTVAENSIAEPGKKTIYVRIAQPDKKILAKGRGDKYTFLYKGEVLQYSIKKEFDYQNKAIDFCIHWNRRQSLELQPGIYYVDLFEGDHNIGSATFELK